MPVRITSELPGHRLQAARLRLALRRLLKKTAVSNLELSVLLVDEPRIRELNRRFRGLDQVTDVIAFPQMDSGELAGLIPGGAGGDELLGDVVICVPVACRQAVERGGQVADELELLGCHGLLHLLGHEDETEEGAREMLSVEKELLGRAIIEVDFEGGR